LLAARSKKHGRRASQKPTKIADVFYGGSLTALPVSWLGPRGQCRECLDRKLTNACPPGEKTGRRGAAAAAMVTAAAVDPSRRQSSMGATSGPVIIRSINGIN
jgi:hypothetical protein